MKLIFVYNANSGVFNTVTDIAHKILSPKTYQCNLCSLTHGYFSAREEWLGYLKTLDIEMQFLHRDEFLKAYPDISVDLPAVFHQQNDQLKLWLGQQQINRMKSIQELVELMRSTLQDPAHDWAELKTVATEGVS